MEIKKKKITTTYTFLSLHDFSHKFAEIPYNNSANINFLRYANFFF